MKPIIIGGILLLLVGGYLIVRQTQADQSQTNGTPSTTIQGSQKPTTEAKITLADGLYTINTQASSIGWMGKKIAGSHAGIVPLKEGSFDVVNSVPTSGSFTADLSNLTSPDGEGLVKHLKGTDFFDVAKYPTATFKLTKGEAGLTQNSWNLSGDMTIKGVTNPITVPVTLSKKDGRLVGTSSLKLDRTLWKVTYGSGKFFAGIGDKAIDDLFDLSLNFELVPSAK